MFISYFVNKRTSKQDYYQLLSFMQALNKIDHTESFQHTTQLGKQSRNNIVLNSLSHSRSTRKTDNPPQRQMKPNDFKDFESEPQRRTNGINGKANNHHQMRTMTNRTRHCHFISKTFGHSQQSKGTSNPI